jgi:hypothetical protein
MATITSPPTFPAPISPAQGYVLEEERIIDKYAIRRWHNPAENSSYGDMLTIAAVGQSLTVIEDFWSLNDLTGTDITGEGEPDLVVERFTGGAHCCGSTLVYNLGPNLTLVMETPLSNCSGSFQELNGDGTLEFVTCDDLFAYTYCCFAGSPMVTVVLQYQTGRGYVPASPHFVDIYADEISTHLASAQTTGPYGCEWDQTNKCSVLPLILDYLYAGQHDQALTALYQHYPYPDRLVFWAEIIQAVTKSPLYIQEGLLPSVNFPDYYMLQLLTSCGAEWQSIGLLQRGQWGCGQDVPHRDVHWLGVQLGRIGLLNENEYLEIAPEGCTTECRLDILNWADDNRYGSIRLDTTVGFPGAVYRVDGSVSSRWRIRGDLTWEQILP